VKPTPTGNAPLTDNVVGDGYPAVVVTVNAPAEPTANTAASALVITGFLTTVSVNAWAAFGFTPLEAVIVIGKDPDTDGVPAIVAVPLPLSVKLTPTGREPVLVIVVAAGYPAVVVTVKLPALPLVNVAEPALVITGAWLTVSVNAWVAFGFTPLAAVKLSEYDPPAPAEGVPARVAVPSPLSVKPSPAGNTPVREITGVGVPVVVTVNEPAEPTVNVVALALEMVGALPTVSEAALVVALPTVLVNTAR
jgi:hypothetical protein